MPTWVNGAHEIHADVLRAIMRPSTQGPFDVAITGAVAKMGGIAALFTPRRSGLVKVTFTGQIMCDTNTKTTNVALYYGTGAAPANGAAAAGTSTNSAHTHTFLTGMSSSGGEPFFDMVLIDGMTKGTAYWFDYQIGTDDGAAQGRMTGYMIFEEY